MRALVELAATGSGRPITAERLAEAQGIPQKFLQNLLLELRRAGVVISHRGPDGGHTLAEPGRGGLARSVGITEANANLISAGRREGPPVPVLLLARRGGLAAIPTIIPAARLGTPAARPRAADRPGPVQRRVRPRPAAVRALPRAARAAPGARGRARRRAAGRALSRSREPRNPPSRRPAANGRGPSRVRGRRGRTRSCTTSGSSKRPPRREAGAHLRYWNAWGERKKGWFGSFQAFQ